MSEETASPSEALRLAAQKAAAAKSEAAANTAHAKDGAGLKTPATLVDSGSGPVKRYQLQSAPCTLRFRGPNKSMLSISCPDGVVETTNPWLHKKLDAMVAVGTAMKLGDHGTLETNPFQKPPAPIDPNKVN